MRNTFLLFLALTLIAANATGQCPTANISYAGTPFCIALSSPQQVTLSGTGSNTGGTYSSTSGLSINSTTGAITPSLSTAGTYTVTYTIPAAGSCTIVTATTSVVIVDIPSSPTIGGIVQPTCTTSTGGVTLNGLPSFGDWSITANPGIAPTSGSGTSTTIIGLLQNTTYTFKVTNYAGCISGSSGSAFIQPQPSTPAPPVVGSITVPTCPSPTGSVVLSGLPTGTWTLKRYPGGISSGGSTTSVTISGLSTGTYNFTVTNSSSCVSGLSNDVLIPAPPSAPSAPVIGAITQPTCALPTGSVALSGLPSSGTWIVTISPGGSTISSTGTTATFSGISAGTFTFTVTSNGCTSGPSSGVTINTAPVTPSAPQIGTITQPTCATATGSVVLNTLPSGPWVITGQPGNITKTGSNNTPTTISDLTQGTYNFTVTNSANCTSAVSANVVISAQPASPAPPVVNIDCTAGFGNAILTVTSPLGTDLQYSLSGGPFQTSPVFNSVANGNYYLAVRNSPQLCTTLSGIFAVNCGCVNAPALVLSMASDSTCGTTPFTLPGNTFGGSATSVTITENGAGSVNVSTFTASPFAFTYTPAAGDRGKVVTITVTTDNPLGSPCSAAVSTFFLSVNELPSAPLIGNITGVSCQGGAGSVILNGLPSNGWTLTRSPDNVTLVGSGASTTVTGLAAGTYTFTVTNEAGCTSPSSANVIIQPQPLAPTAPVIDTIIHPDCLISTGSVTFSGLPATGTWTLTRLPGGITRPGSGAIYTVTSLPSGTYTYTVTNEAGCVSPPSESIIIKDRPAIPVAPSVGKITAPTCTLSTGSVIMFSLPSTGTWTLTRYPGTVKTTGTGTSDTINGLPTGIYNFTVTSQEGCVSIPSANVQIPSQPVTPTAPVKGKVTQPTLEQPTGSVVLSGLPSSQSWVLTRLPDMVKTSGTGTSFTATALSAGVYKFTVTNASGCTSPESDTITIAPPAKPDVIITDPHPACAPGTVDLTAPEITVGSTPGLIFSYWTDEAATTHVPDSTKVVAGTYYIKGTTVTGFFDIQPVVATVLPTPVAHAGPDQVLPNDYSTYLAATLGENETGVWRVKTGAGEVADTTDPTSYVSKLSQGDNILIWFVSNGACPLVSDTVKIKAGEIVIPTLITPNGDDKNEYFVIQGLESLGKTELLIFDRRGYQLFKNSDYDNKWNGVDYNMNPLPNDTYFFLLKPSKHEPVSGYIMIRR